jgi:hypothetical protein
MDTEKCFKKYGNKNESFESELAAIKTLSGP